MEQGCRADLLLRAHGGAHVDTAVAESDRNGLISDFN